MASNSILSTSGGSSVLLDLTEVLTRKINRMDELLTSLFNNRPSKHDVYAYDQLKECSFNILEINLKTNSSDQAFNVRVVRTVQRILDLLKSSVEWENDLTICKENLIAGFNFQTQQVPEDLKQKGAWHGDLIKSELKHQILDRTPIRKFFAERSSEHIPKGHYLVRSSAAELNNQVDKIDYYVLEYRKNSNGNLMKVLFSYDHKKQVYTQQYRNQKNELVIKTDKTFEGLRAKLGFGSAKPVLLEPVFPKRPPLRCSWEGDSSLDDSSSPSQSVLV